MKSQIDFKKEWQKTKKQLLQFSKEATHLAKKGEQEIVSFSRKGKLHIDSTAAGLKKEHLYYLIGKEYTKMKEPGEQSRAMKKLLSELETVNKQQRDIKSKLKTSNPSSSKK